MKAISQSVAPECVWPVAAELGEGPLWWNEAVWFVDIKQDKIHCLDPVCGTGKSWNAPAAPGFLAPLKDGRFIAGTKAGLQIFTPDSGRFDGLAAAEPDQPGNRLNDGAVDASGRLWFGSMDDAHGKAWMQRHGKYNLWRAACSGSMSKRRAGRNGR